MLFVPCTENAIIRDGHQPFKRTIFEALVGKAKENPAAAFVADELHQARFKRGRKR